MNRPFIFKLSTHIILMLLLPSIVRASISPGNSTISVPYHNHDFFLISGDVATNQREDIKQEKNPKKPDPIKKPDQPDIRKVPKARKQARPPVVVKPKIKVKPKIVRPNIKRP